MSTIRQYQISYRGEKLMKIFAKTSREAKEKAVYTFQREGRRGMNLAFIYAQLIDVCSE